MTNKAVSLARLLPNSGTPILEDFKLIDVGLRPLQQGDVLIETLYISIDGMLRLFMSETLKAPHPHFNVGESLYSIGAGRVKESRNENYAVGDILATRDVWEWPFQQYVIWTHDEVNKYPKVNVPPQLHSALVGVLGMSGWTAYNIDQKLEAKKGETLIINAAAGAVGTIVGQMFKNRGAGVIGIVGSEEKAKVIKELGFDVAITYKGKSQSQLSEEIKKAAPEGISKFVDNVGGEQAVTIINHINNGGRIAICGHISEYSSEKPPTFGYPEEVQKSLTERGIFVKHESVVEFQKSGDVDKAIADMSKDLLSGKLVNKETVYEGIEKLPQALVGIYHGELAEVSRFLRRPSPCLPAFQKASLCSCPQ
eukprot:TRINITY_DN6742_c0_g1_i2.p1 TRINITY_DN6742_c0_g1~~TRINITY_DN6742_c0_g1_i2.p1  ORF type:complete len:387 (+),score=66.62 TRINITY_DN6742_c0_g1_i2:62-1162(+)